MLIAAVAARDVAAKDASMVSSRVGAKVTPKTLSVGGALSHLSGPDLAPPIFDFCSKFAQT
jgi:hypothetical protein